MARTTDSQAMGTVGTGRYLVRQGDCLDSIAVEHGFFWETIWNDAGNSELRSARQNAFAIFPGDRVHIPDLRMKYETRASEARHRFRRRGVPSYLDVVLKWVDEPLADEPYVIDIDGVQRTGRTDSEGRVHEPIPPNARSAVLTVGEDAEVQQVYHMVLGNLDPVDTVTGMQHRLANLGFDVAITGDMDDQTREVLREFQECAGLEVTGEADPGTRDALERAHG